MNILDLRPAPGPDLFGIGFGLAADHHEAREQVGTPRADAQRDVAPDRDPRNHRLLDAERVEKLAVGLRNQVDRVIVRVERGVAMARHVGRDDAIAELAKVRELRIPEVLVVPEAVQEQDRHPAATVVVRDSSAVGKGDFCQDLARCNYFM